MMEQVPNEWNPHQRLEFFKMAIRTTMADAVGRDRGELRRSISEIEENLDDMHKLKCAACAVLNNQDRENKKTSLYRLADRLLLLKCYDNKKVKSPG